MATVVPWGDARVACLWLPHLPLRREVVLRPALDGRPLVLGSAPGQRRVVELGSPEAETAGPTVGLPLREVASLCPEAVTVQPIPRGSAPPVRGPGRAPGRDLGRRAGGRRVPARPARPAGAARRQPDAPGRAVWAVSPPLLRPRLGNAADREVAGIAARHAPPIGRLVVRAYDAVAFLRQLPIDARRRTAPAPGPTRPRA